MRGLVKSLIVAATAALFLAGCNGEARIDPANMTAAALVDPYALADQGRTSIQGADYQIGSADLLNITVFQVPELSFSGLRVDSSGSIQMPLIGAVRAEGLTPQALSNELARLLSVRYLRDPQVTVTVAEAANQKVTVDGAVSKPGVYNMRGRTTLMQAVAMAEGPLRTADTRKVAVFRTTEQGRMVAVFDLSAIRAGQAEDPVLLGDDIVVVDTSRLSLAVRDIVSALPAAGAIFYALNP